MNQDSRDFVVARNASVAYRAPRNILDQLMGRKKIGPAVLRKLSFSLGLGDHAVLFGPASSGKTTLLRALTGVLSTNSGTLLVNGKKPGQNADAAAGYVSFRERVPAYDTVYEVLQAHGSTHQVNNLPSRIGELAESIGFSDVLQKRARNLSQTNKLKLNLAIAALSHAPLILLDDVADLLGAREVARLLSTVFAGRTVIVATKHEEIAEQLELPLLLLAAGTVVHQGHREEIAHEKSSPRVIEAWVADLSYQLYRQLKNQAGVTAISLQPAQHYRGQKLVIELQSGHFLPKIYDMLSQTDLVKVIEHSPNLNEVVSRASTAVQQ